jgi:hypothetical protein
LTASAAPGAADYVWSLSDGEITAGQGTSSITYTAPAAGTSFNISLFVTDTNICNGTCSATVELSSEGCDPAPATITACGADAGVCGAGTGSLMLLAIPLLQLSRSRQRRNTNRPS